MGNTNDISKVTDLLEMIKKGRNEYLIDLYKFMNTKMTFFAKVYLNDTSFVTDVIHDALMRILKSIGEFDASKNSINWIIKIVKHAALQYNNRWNSTCIFDVNQDMIAADDMLEYRIMIDDYCVELSDDERRVFIDYFIYGYTIREIASKECKPKSNISRIILVLKEKFSFIYRGAK